MAVPLDFDWRKRPPDQFKPLIFFTQSENRRGSVEYTSDKFVSELSPDELEVYGMQFVEDHPELFD